MLFFSQKTLCKRLLILHFMLLWLCAPFILTLSASGQDVTTNTAQSGNQKCRTEANGFRLKAVSLLFHRWTAERIVEFNFSLEKDKRESLAELHTSDMAVLLDSNQIPLRPDALKTTGQDPIKVLLLIDGSLSMVNLEMGFNKIRAAKDALSAFVDNLRQNDQAIIYQFNATMHPVQETLTNDKQQLRNALSKVIPSRDSPDAFSTNLYQGLREAVTIAERHGIHSLVIFSDGMQDSTDSPDPLTPAFGTYKEEQEKEIAATAIEKGVRIFAIPIGNRNAEPKAPKNKEYVDADTLCNIATSDPSGLCDYVDFPKLKGRAERENVPAQTLLEKDLALALEKIRQATMYTYTLDIPLNMLAQDGRPHDLTILTNEAGTRPPLCVTYPLMWSPNATVPVPEAPIEKSIFLRTPKKNVPISQLAIVYVSIIGMLALLSLTPMMVGKVQHAAKVRQQLNALSTSVMRLDSKSPFIGDHCPNEETVALKAGDVVVRCPKCERVHHLDCWQYSMFRCMERHCSGELPIPDSIFEKFQV